MTFQSVIYMALSWIAPLTAIITRQPPLLSSISLNWISFMSARSPREATVIHFPCDKEFQQLQLRPSVIFRPLSTPAATAAMLHLLQFKIIWSFYLLTFKSTTLALIFLSLSYFYFLLFFYCNKFKGCLSLYLQMFI